MSKPPISSGSFQKFRTPQYIFDALNRDLGPFGLDAAAEADNAKCLLFLGEDQNSLSPDTKWLSPTGVVFCNPPYKKILPWLQRAEVAVAREECSRVVFLLPAFPSSKWFIQALTRHEAHLYEGRIPFETPPGMVNPRRPAAGSVIVIVDRGVGGSGLTKIRSSKTGEVVHVLAR